MRLAIALGLVLCAAGYADVITLKSGRVINGTYLGGDAHQVKIAEGDQVETFPVTDVARIEFGNGSGAVAPSGNRPVLRRADSSDNAPPPSSNDGRPTLRRADSSSSDSSYGSSSNSSSGDNRPTLRRADSSSSDSSYGSSSNSSSGDNRPTLRRADSSDTADTSPSGSGPRTPVQILRPDDSEPSVSSPPQQAPPPAPAPVQLAAGTNLVIRMIDAVDSAKASPGQSFAATMDEPVMVNGETVIPRGADVVVRLLDAKDSGKLTGRAELALSLMSVKVNGRVVEINTQTVNREGDSRGAKTAKVVGVGAAIGTIVGAAAGGGKGAAVGAGAGAATGAGVQLATRGEHVKVPSETRLTFVLDSPVNI